MKYNIVIILLLLTITSKSQNIKEIQSYILNERWEEAEKSINSYLNNPSNQNDASGWYYKAVIYNKSAKNNTLNNFNKLRQAFDAYKRYQDLDYNNTLGKLEQNVTLFALYSDFYNEAIQYHNSNDYGTALAYYQSTIDVQEYIYKNSFTYNNQKLPKLDTALKLYAGSAAILVGDTILGIKYFKEIADGEVYGDDYLEAYKMVVDFYNRTGDHYNKNKYIAIASKLYPDDEYWVYFELYDPILQHDKNKLFLKYEELIFRNPNNSVIALDYAIELFNYTYSNDKPRDYTSLQSKLENIIQKAIYIGNSAESNFLMVQHLSNKIYDLQELQRSLNNSTRTNDIQKRYNITAEINQLNTNSIIYAEEAVKSFSLRPSLKMVDKVNYKILLNQLITYYKNNNVLEKSSYYNSKLINIDKIKTDDLASKTSNNNNNKSSTTKASKGIVEIPMQLNGGVYMMPCVINGLKFKFIFDTGASTVSISSTEALFMLKNNYLSENDIIGTTRFSTADGSIHEGTVINLKELIIGGIVLKNVKASVVHNANAPLLLGQSALNKLGEFTMNYSRNVLIIKTN